MYVCVHAYIRTSARSYTNIHVYIYIHMCMYIYIYICVCIYLYIYINKQINVNVYVRMSRRSQITNTNEHSCTHIDVCVHTYTRTSVRVLPNFTGQAALEGCVRATAVSARCYEVVPTLPANQESVG